MPDRGLGDAKLKAEVAALREQLAELRARLREPEEIIRAIRQGEVDAVVVNDRRGTGSTACAAPICSTAG